MLEKLKQIFKRQRPIYWALVEKDYESSTVKVKHYIPQLNPNAPRISLARFKAGDALWYNEVELFLYVSYQPFKVTFRDAINRVEWTQDCEPPVDSIEQLADAVWKTILDRGYAYAKRVFDNDPAVLREVLKVLVGEALP